MEAPATQEICRVEDIPATGHAVTVNVAGKSQSVLLVREDGNVHAYVNDCPHMRWQLAFTEGFFDTETKLIKCRNHGALFRGESGYCVEGPCQGKSLAPFPVRVADGKVWCAS